MKEVISEIFKLLKDIGDNEKRFVRNILIATICYSFAAFLSLPSFLTNPLPIPIFIIMSGSILFTLFLYIPILSMTDKNQKLTHNILLFVHVYAAAILCILSPFNLDYNIWHLLPLYISFLFIAGDLLMMHDRRKDKKAQEQQNSKD